MVLPVTDRIRYVNVWSPAKAAWIYKSTQVGKAQAMPIDRALQYSRTIRDIRLLENSLVNVGGADNLEHVPSSVYAAPFNHGFNRSYAKLKDGVESAGLGVNIVEYRQARDMFTTRGLQFVEIGSLLLRKKFGQAGQRLKCYFYDGRPPRRNRSGWVLPDLGRKSNISLSNLWLEWHFGLSPLIGDCQDAAKVLTDPLPSSRLRGRSPEESLTYEDEWWDPGNPGYGWTRKRVTRIRTQQSCEAAITNPNLALANQLGVLNPAQLLWEIVPFSFVVDWVVNVGDWLQGFSDFAGMTLDYAVKSQRLYTDDRLTHWGPAGVIRARRNGMLLSTSRSIGLTGPSLGFKPLKLPSLSRTATIWSLASQLVQRR